MKYSIRMRAAQGGPHENGGRHISGAERILAKDELAGTAGELVSRALHHSKGEADFIRITVDAIPPESIRYIPCLRIDGTRMGQTAAGWIADRAEGKTVAQPVVDIGFSIVERGSS